MKQALSKQAMRTRDRFFSALRALSLRDGTTARSARRIEHQVNEALFQVERYAQKHKHTAGRSAGDSLRIAAKWLELAAESAEIDADLADLLSLFARHWLLIRVGAQHATGWIQRAEALVRMLSLRAEQTGQSMAFEGGAYAGDRPMLTLVLRGLPRGTQPVDVEVDLADGALIGRADHCDWVLPGEVVSRQHAQLRYDAQLRAFFVKNLSRNGLAVDAVELGMNQERELTVGAEICIPKEGHYVVLVQSAFVPIGAMSLFRSPERESPDGGGRDVAALAAPHDPAVVVLDEDVDAAPVEPAESATSLELRNTGARRIRPWPVSVDALSSTGDAGARFDPLDDDFEARDPRGLVTQLLADYNFLTPAAAEAIRRYVYGQQDAASVVTAIFADVLTAPPAD